ncbi:hypothetical protein WJ50_17560 [Burkholderia ubonensis]|nr:hypothetical protein WJ49_08370 [Burkholderia ubonensis]KVL87587.1 hypothetical protein WJ50_17560 [Burkholderia ubonensis]
MIRMSITQIIVEPARLVKQPAIGKTMRGHAFRGRASDGRWSMRGAVVIRVQCVDGVYSCRKGLRVGRYAAG